VGNFELAQVLRLDWSLSLTSLGADLLDWTTTLRSLFGDVRYITESPVVCHANVAVDVLVLHSIIPLPLSISCTSLAASVLLSASLILLSRCRYLGRDPM
jgi:hypothetical protein